MLPDKGFKTIRKLVLNHKRNNVKHNNFYLAQILDHTVCVHTI